MKNVKMSQLITISVGCITLVSLLILCMVSNRNTNDILEQAAVNNMSTALDAQASIIKRYIDVAERELKQYASAKEVRDLMKNEHDAVCQSITQKYTEEFYSHMPGWEGIYTGNWNTTVLAHSNAGSIGLTTRKDDALLAFRDQLMAEDDYLYNGGAFVSPASGLLIINMHMAVLDDDGVTPIGMVGGGPFISGIGSLLDEIAVEGLENASYTILDSKKGIYVLNPDAELITENVEDEDLLEVLEKVRGGSTAGRSACHKDDGSEYVLCYKSIPEYDLVVVMMDSADEIYAQSKTSTRNMFLICASMLLVIVIGVFILSNFITKPLKLVVNAVEKLSRFSLGRDASIQKYVGGNSEIGIVATAVATLTDEWGRIVDKLGSSQESMSSNIGDMKNASFSLVECASENMATTQQLSDSIVRTNESLQLMNGEIEKITELVRQVNVKVEDGGAKSDMVITSTQDMVANTGQTLSGVEKKVESTKQDIREALNGLKSLTKINEIAGTILSITQ